jgi:hypothetical protein
VRYTVSNIVFFKSAKSCEAAHAALSIGPHPTRTQLFLTLLNRSVDTDEVSNDLI